jgi:hypothetical protein
MHQDYSNMQQEPPPPPQSSVLYKMSILRMFHTLCALSSRNPPRFSGRSGKLSSYIPVHSVLQPPHPDNAPPSWANSNFVLPEIPTPSMPHRGPPRYVISTQEHGMPNEAFRFITAWCQPRAGMPSEGQWVRFRFILYGCMRRPSPPNDVFVLCLAWSDTQLVRKSFSTWLTLWGQRLTETTLKDSVPAAR